MQPNSSWMGSWLCLFLRHDIISGSCELSLGFFCLFLFEKNVSTLFPFFLGRELFPIHPLWPFSCYYILTNIFCLAMFGQKTMSGFISCWMFGPFQFYCRLCLVSESADPVLCLSVSEMYGLLWLYQQIESICNGSLMLTNTQSLAVMLWDKIQLHRGSQCQVESPGWQNPPWVCLADCSET